MFLYPVGIDLQALKEWAVVCRALEDGRQVLILRKGGILEYRQGFEIKHERFWLFPTFEHQSEKYIKDDYSAKLYSVLSEPPSNGTNRLSSFASAEGVWPVKDMAALRPLEKYHIWTESYVRARMEYNPTKPLSVVLLRVFRVAAPVVVDIKPEWAGCKSWIPVNLGLDLASMVAEGAAGSSERTRSIDARPALPDAVFNEQAAEIKEALSA